VAKIKGNDNKTPKPTTSLQKNRNEVRLEDVYIALADFIIDSFLESRKVEKVINLKGAQLKHKEL